MIDGLRDYLSGVGANDFVLGESDCCTFMADWLIRLGLPDVMADRRGSYATPREYRRMLMAEGGLVAACQRRFTAAGLRIGTVARAGDVAVMMVPYSRRAGALHYRATGAIALSASHFVTIVRHRRFCICSTMPVAKMWTTDA